MGYRDDELALAHREATLARALDHCDAELERLRLLEQQRDEIARELHDVRAQRRSQRPAVDELRATSPCRARWEMMEGDGCARACHLCGKRVYDVSGAGAAARLIADEGALALGRLRRRADGTVVVGDCPRGAVETRRRRAVVGGGTAFVVATALAAAAAAPSPPSTAHTVVDPQGLAGAPAVGATEVELDDEIAVDVDR